MVLFFEHTNTTTQLLAREFGLSFSATHIRISSTLQDLAPAWVSILEL
jgi:hypothetical protein